MKLKHQIAMVAGLVILAGCSEKDPMTSTQHSNVPAVTRESSSAGSAPDASAASRPATAAPATPESKAPAPPMVPTNSGTANTLTNTTAPEAK